jgi:hypothetical protein
MTTQTTDTLRRAATAASGSKPRDRVWRIFKAGGIGLSVLISAVYLANWLWEMSGSNRWELKIDREGTQVYTLKSPGSAMIKVRAVTRSKEFTLSNHLAPFFDESIQDNCGEWVAGCLNYKILKPWDPKIQRNVTMWTLALFPPLAPREFVLQGQLFQDPQTKRVTLENIAAPNNAPRNDCCVRIEHVHNVWHYTPLPDGSIEVEFLSDMDMGGAFPKFLLNLGAPAQLHKMLAEENPKLLRQAKYRSATVDFLDAGKVSATAPE